MKIPARSLLVAFAAATTLSAWAAAAPAPLAADSTVHAVTVYPDRALVSRTAAIELPAGESTFVLADLPANLWDNSLQVRGRGPDGFTLVDVQSRNVFVEATPSPELRTLEDTLNTLRRQDTALVDEANALQSQRGVLERIIGAATSVPTEGAATPRPGFDEWRQLLAFSAENTTRLDAAKRDLAQRREDLAAKISAAQNQLNEARGRLTGRRAVKAVTVRLTSPVAGPATLELSYTVPGAQWTPTYNARLDSTTSQVAFDYQAQVTNRTGEAWTNVALTLSTARPDAGGAAPEAQPWIVEPTPTRVFSSMGGLKDKAVRGMAMNEVAAPAMLAASADMSVAQATVESGLTAATFRIAAPATIPSDGTVQNVAVTTVTLPAALRYAATPKAIAAVFLTAKVSNRTEFPLLAGELAAFVDGAFITNSHLEQTMPGADFELALGVDDGIELTRTLTNRFVEKTGFTNGGQRTTYEVNLKLTNHKRTAVTLQLAEPLPVSRHEKIVVKLLSPADRDIGKPDDATKAFQRDDQGILTWTGTLAAGAERELTLKFSIEHPADMDVTGVE